MKTISSDCCRNTPLSKDEKVDQRERACPGDFYCELSAKNICFKNYRVFDAEKNIKNVASFAFIMHHWFVPRRDNLPIGWSDCPRASDFSQMRVVVSCKNRESLIHEFTFKLMTVSAATSATVAAWFNGLNGGRQYIVLDAASRCPVFDKIFGLIFWCDANILKTCFIHHRF